MSTTMGSRSIFGFVLSLLTTVSPAAQPKEVNLEVIPLTQIWSNGMPGTRDIDELKKKLSTGSHKDALAEIADCLLNRESQAKRKGEKASPGFVVEGNGLTALNHALAVLRTGKSPSVINHGVDATLIFFMYPANTDIQLDNVQRTQEGIEVEYRFVSYIERNLSMGFAMIPLGKLPVGKYHVGFRQLATLQGHGSKRIPTSPPFKSPDVDAAKIVSQSFSFEVIAVETEK